MKLRILLALSYSLLTLTGLNAQISGIHTGFMGYHSQDSYGSTTGEGYSFEINIDGDNLGTVGASANVDNGTPDGIDIPLVSEVSDSDYIQFADYDSTLSNPSSLQGDYGDAGYATTLTALSLYGQYKSSIPPTGDLPSSPSGQLILTDANNPTPAYWNSFGQLVIDTSHDTVLSFSGDFTADLNQVSFYGAMDSLEEQTFDASGQYTIPAGVLANGGVYEVELLSVNGTQVNGEYYGDIEDFPGSFTPMESDIFQGYTTEFEVLAVPEPSTYAFFAGVIALVAGIIRRKRR